MFSVDQWVIDTKKKITPTIKAILPETYPIIYVLYDSDAGEYYISDKSNLIEYDKYWFDGNGEGR